MDRQRLVVLIGKEKYTLHPGRFYRHYKGTDYLVIGTAVLEKDGKDGEIQVLYKEEFDDFVWARPLSEWFELVEHKGINVNRFTLSEYQLGRDPKQWECTLKST